MDQADPDRVGTLEELARELDLLRRAEGRRRGKHRLSLQDLVRSLRQELGRELPRSTLDNYVSGRTLPPPDVYEDLLRVLRVDTSALRPWAEAWERLDDLRTRQQRGTVRTASAEVESARPDTAHHAPIAEVVPTTGDEDPLDRAVRGLAAAIERQWTVEAEMRSLHRPRPVRVAWSPTTRPVVARSADGGDPGLRGDVTGVVQQFRRTPARQLVVLGEPGAGKTVLAVLLTLGLLADRRPDEPVPVLLSLGSWRPHEEHLQTWLARMLVREYPGVGSTASYGERAATRLVVEHRVLPVLDGLDEMPAGFHAEAIDALDRVAAEGFPLVVTSRAAEYENAIAQAGAVLSHASVVEIEPVEPSAAATFLTAREPQGSSRWQPVVEHLERNPTGPLARALRTPLMLDLARTAYSDARTDPAELTDETRFPDRVACEDHLLDSYLPAVYAHRPTPPDRRPPRRYDPERAARWLTFLAHYLHQQRTRDFAWWRLDRSVPRAVVAALLCLPPALLFGLAGGIAGGTRVGVVYGLAFGFGGWLAQYLGHRPGPRRAELVFRGTALAFLVRSAVGVLIGIGFGLGWSLSAPMVLFLAVVFAVGIGSHAWLDTPVDANRVASPRTVLGNDRVAALWFTASFGLSVGVFYGTAFAFTSETRFITIWDGGFDLVIAFVAGGAAALLGWFLLGRVASLGYGLAGLAVGGLVFPRAEDLAMALGAGAVVGLAVGAAVVLSRASGVFTVLRLWLAARGRLPLRLMRFLDDAHRRGVLRQVGAVYQFRHARLGDRLVLRSG